MSKNAMLMSATFARQFAQEWVAGWNAHDIEKILSHYTDDFSIESLFAFRQFPDTQGVVTGKSKVREYWTSALRAMPDLHFEWLDVLSGINSICLYYRSVSAGRQVAEVMFFNTDCKVFRSVVMYS